MKKFFFHTVSVFLIALCILPVTYARAAVPQSIEFMVDVSTIKFPGNVIADITFSLLDQGGATVASEVKPQVDVTNIQVYKTTLGAAITTALSLANGAPMTMSVVASYLDKKGVLQTQALGNFPIGSTAYSLNAQSADNAKDVLGMDINPNSITINGTLVIDSTGKWIGPPIIASATATMLSATQNPTLSFDSATGALSIGIPYSIDGVNATTLSPGSIATASVDINKILQLGIPQGLMGLQGVQGLVGPQGPIGLTGPQGPIGLTGPQGLQGDVGPQGPIGLTGPQGPIGLTGPQGPQGDIGPQGPIGLTGPQGPQGLQGDVGPQGPIGLTGPQGPVGATGPQGPQGIQGVNGAQGDTPFTSVTATALPVGTNPTSVISNGVLQLGIPVAGGTGSDHIIAVDTVLNVPSQYPSIQAALDYLGTKRIMSNAKVTIQVADGTYTHTQQISVTHLDGGRIRIWGNLSVPSRCRLVFQGEITGIQVVTALGIIDGFSVEGGSPVDRAGIDAGNKSAVQVGGNMIVTKFTNGLSAHHSSYIHVRPNFLATQNSNAGVHVAESSSIICLQCRSTYNKYGFAATMGGNLRVDGSVSQYNQHWGYIANAMGSIYAINTASGATGNGLGPYNALNVVSASGGFISDK